MTRGPCDPNLARIPSWDFAKLMQRLPSLLPRYVLNQFRV